MKSGFIRVGIIDCDKEFRRNLRDSFKKYSSGIETVFENDSSAAGDPESIVDKVRRTMCNALFISRDTESAQNVIDRIKGDRLFHTAVIVIEGDSEQSENVLINADFMIRRSFDLFMVNTRLCNICSGEYIHGWSDDKERLYIIAEDILCRWGLTVPCAGYDFLTEAAVLTVYDREYISSVSALYFAVGRKCGTTDANVEKCIRTAIDKAYRSWSRRTEVCPKQEITQAEYREAAEAVFGDVKPVNGKFFLMLLN